MKNFFSSLPFRMIVSIAVGLLLGFVANEQVMAFVVVIDDMLITLINFVVPLIVIGFIAPSIANLGAGASKTVGLAFSLAYFSTLLSALLTYGISYVVVPLLSDTATSVTGAHTLPDMVLDLDMPPLMSVTAALVLSILIGLAAGWSKAQRITEILNEFQAMVLGIIEKVIIPILPVFIAATFCKLAYQGSITKQLPVFLADIVIATLLGFGWVLLLYAIGGLYSKKKPWGILRNYIPAFITAVGTMSSAATLPVSLESARASKELDRDMLDFGVPLFANIHLCGSMLAEVFFVMNVSLVLTGAFPSLPNMILFCVVGSVVAVGAPGVPGGVVMATMGVLTGILGFDSTAVALVVSIFSLQDGFGTAWNVVGDGALTLFLTGYKEKRLRQKSSPAAQK